MPTGENTNGCKRCRGIGWYSKDVEAIDPDFGKVFPCPSCADLLRTSGLKSHERDTVFADVRDIGSDTDGHRMVMRVAGATVVRDAKGFVTLWGDTGSAKSVWAKALVVGLCRKGIPCRYIHAKKLEQSLFSTNGKDAYKVESHGASRDYMLRVQALVVDEAHQINWKNEWIAAEMSDIFDARFRNADHPDAQNRQITAFVSQYDPQEWAPDFLLSRMRDSTFAIPWPDNLNKPECVGDLYGQPHIVWPFCMVGPDLRSALPSGMTRAARVDPRTGEIIE